MDRSEEGEAHGSFFQGAMCGGAGILLLLYLFIPEIVVDNAFKLFSYDDSVYCEKREDLGNRVAECKLNFRELDGLKKIFCYAKKDVLNCQVYADEDFKTPGYISELLGGE